MSRQCFQKSQKYTKGKEKILDKMPSFLIINLRIIFSFVSIPFFVLNLYPESQFQEDPFTIQSQESRCAFPGA
jgi:hypothetical protein